MINIKLKSELNNINIKTVAIAYIFGYFTVNIFYFYELILFEKLQSNIVSVRIMPQS